MPDSILIVEDYLDARSFMVTVFSLGGFQVYEAGNGVEALECTARYRPNLILMDISMPIMNGIEATKLIRAAGDDISGTPIIAVTAFDENIQHSALAAGCNEIVPKPVEFETLEAAVRRCLPWHQSF